MFLEGTQGIIWSEIKDLANVRTDSRRETKRKVVVEIVIARGGPGVGVRKLCTEWAQPAAARSAASCGVALSTISRLVVEGRNASCD